MPSLEENAAAWEEEIRWRRSGDDWSETWGGVGPQWHGAILPRVRRFLPATSVLEIAPGHGRWTQFLLGHCDSLTGVDLSRSCVETCRSRFAGYDATFHQTDGRSLEMVADGSIDFAFSFDSLVHVEIDVLEAYVGELRRVLAPGGQAFLHHSNLLAHAAYFTGLGRLPNRLRARAERFALVDRTHWRGVSVSADAVRSSARAVGLWCRGQEMVNWGSRRTIDCFSWLQQPPSESRNPPPIALSENPHFMAEAASIRAASDVWSSRPDDP